LAASRLPEKRQCGCTDALGPAIVTDLKLASENEKKKLDLLIGKYIKKE
jgi:hypothetical protein